MLLLTGSATPEMLADAIAIHYAAHLAAYGHSIWLPKHHFMLHIPRQLQKFKLLIACFVVKKWAVPLASKRAYERTLIEACTCSRTCEHNPTRMLVR